MIVVAKGKEQEADEGTEDSNETWIGIIWFSIINMNISRYLSLIRNK